MATVYLPPGNYGTADFETPNDYVAAGFTGFRGKTLLNALSAPICSSLVNFLSVGTRSITGVGFLGAPSSLSVFLEDSGGQNITLTLTNCYFASNVFFACFGSVSINVVLNNCVFADNIYVEAGTFGGIGASAYVYINHCIVLGEVFLNDSLGDITATAKNTIINGLAYQTWSFGSGSGVAVNPAVVWPNTTNLLTPINVVPIKGKVGVIGAGLAYVGMPVMDAAGFSRPFKAVYPCIGPCEYRPAAGAGMRISA